jgi:chitodextrinase
MKLRRAIERASESLPDEVATDVPELFQNWESETVYSVGDRRQYNGILWKCIQAHTSQDDWTPDVAVSLWTRTSVDEWPEWIQPTGASDSYQLDDKVSHNEKHWVSLYDNNVWEPGVFGWQEQ